MAGLRRHFGGSIKFVSSNKHLSADSQVCAKVPPIVIVQPLAVIGPGQFSHLTGYTLQTKISHETREWLDDIVDLKII